MKKNESKLSTDSNLFDNHNKFVLETGSRKFTGYHFHPEKLSQAMRDILVEKLYPLAMSSFGQPDSPNFKKDVTEHILNNPNVLVILEGNKFIAFRMWNVLENSEGKIVYLAGMCIDKDYQGSGLGSEMLHYVYRYSTQTIPDWKYMVLRTQNAIMQKTFESFVKQINSGKLYGFGSEEIPQEIQNIAMSVATLNHDKNLNPTTLLSEGVYGASLYGNDVDITVKNGSSLTKIHPEKGDAVYSVWKK